jgi:outer membrane protein assembly factor BamA
LSYSISSFRGSLPVGSALDPYATVTIKPPQGMLGTVHVGYGFSNVEGTLDGAGGAIRGFSMRFGVDYASPATGSSYTLHSFEGSVAGYIPMPWPGTHTLALRAAGGVADGSYPRSGYFFVGGYNIAPSTFIDTITSGAYDGAFVLRGYAPRSLAGRSYILHNVEYRVPILKPDRGLSTLPFYMRRLDGNVFFDYGGAFDNLDLAKIGLFTNGAIIDSPVLHAALGAEIWLGLTIGYFVNTQLRFGYAYGFSSKAIPFGQPYFVASGAF